MEGCKQDVPDADKEKWKSLAQEIASKDFLKNNISKIEDIDGRNSPFVVLVGYVGVGKSSTTEKLTGVKGRKSSAAESATTSTEYFWAPNKSLLIADTPGSNPRVKERFGHNLEIAAAMNFKDVSKLLIVVRAHKRIGQTISDIEEFIRRFAAFPDELIGVLVTHMDIPREWEEKEMIEACGEDFGIEDIVFSQPNRPGPFLQNRIIEICGKTPFKLDIDSRLFLRMFSFEGNRKKILNLTGAIVDRFKQYKQLFEDEKQKFSSEEQVDLFFEYKAFMENQIDQAQKELCEKLEIDFCHEDEKINIQHAGYVASMVNQLRAIIYDIRIEALKYHNKHGSSDLRECPYCGCIWAKVEGCEGYTTCGAIPTSAVDINRDVFEMATFSFKVIQVKEGEIKFEIMKNGKKELRKDGLNAEIDGALSEAVAKIDPLEFQHFGGKSFYNIPKEYMHLYKDTKGCHRLINWDYMKKVSAYSDEFHVKDEGAHVNTDDIMTLPKEAKSVFEAIDRQLQAKKKNS